MLCCKGCEKWWHSCCVNMKESAENIKDWKCPFCYVSRFTPVAFIKAAFPEFLSVDLYKQILKLFYLL